nr:hypothetical protein CFP56_74629 [Quercus suber]
MYCTFGDMRPRRMNCGPFPPVHSLPRRHAAHSSRCAPLVKVRHHSIADELIRNITHYHSSYVLLELQYLAGSGTGHACQDSSWNELDRGPETGLTPPVVQRGSSGATSCRTISLSPGLPDHVLAFHHALFASYGSAIRGFCFIMLSYSMVPLSFVASLAP